MTVKPCKASLLEDRERLNLDNSVFVKTMHDLAKNGIANARPFPKLVQVGVLRETYRELNRTEGIPFFAVITVSPNIIVNKEWRSGPIYLEVPGRKSIGRQLD